MLIGVLNFLLVAAFGLLMRSKIIFPITWFDQKFLMHAHSHFAFSGWVTQVLMLLLVKEIHGLSAKSKIPFPYHALLGGNLLLSFGMLIGFAWSGYSTFSIVCSFFIVLLSYVFVLLLWKDLNRREMPMVVKYIFRGALFFNVFSSLGTFGLAVLKATHSIDTLKQLASVYFYLHFQYNGWFMLSCLGLVVWWFHRHRGVLLLDPKWATVLMASIVPTYFLSLLWWKALPGWLFYVLILSVLLQFFIWTKVLLQVKSTVHSTHPNGIHRALKWIWICVVLALSTKLVLQVLSVIPSLSAITYSYRPVVIAYLHLVLLGIISLFLLGYAFTVDILIRNKWVNAGIYLLLIGIFLNESLLVIQGGEGILGYVVKNTNVGLFVAALLMFISIALLLVGQVKAAVLQIKK